MTGKVSRREALMSAAALAALPSVAFSAPQDRPKDEPFKYCLNTSTLRGQKLPIMELVEVAAKAGFHALEPWIFELEMHKSAAPLKDLGKKIADLGLTVESAIGFAPWIVDDERSEERRVGKE